jgi:arsenical pump membrane protein
MWAALIISLAAVIGMLLCLAFFPELKLGKFTISTFWMPPFLAAVILLSFRLVDFSYFWSSLTNDSAINPLEILVLFISMTFLSIVLDEAGFFSYIAAKSVDLAKGSQFALFIILYVLTSVLTVFTSNDIIVLTFTPFIIFFAKNAKIDPIPYLVGEFVGANSWSMLIVIGNPTNIYLASSFGIDFGTYFQNMWLATILGGLTSFFLMMLIFHKKLSKKIEPVNAEAVIKDRFFLAAGLITLGACLILLVISSIIDLPMWIISAGAAVVLLAASLIYIAVHREKGFILGDSIKRLPYDIIPFVLSMFAIVIALKENGLTTALAGLLNKGDPIWTYGFASFFSANFINNIPMSVFFTEVIRDGGEVAIKSVYASIIGSNIGAFLTPVGALAGVMWMSILKRHGIKFSFLDFAKYGALIAIPTMAMALVGLMLV